MSITYDKDDDALTFFCPHCDMLIQVLNSETNCLIFRHGIIIENQQQMNPHTPENECDILVKEKKIFGCGRPFKIINNKTNVEKCGYL